MTKDIVIESKLSKSSQKSVEKRYIYCLMVKNVCQKLRMCIQQKWRSPFSDLRGREYTCMSYLKIEKTCALVKWKKTCFLKNQDCLLARGGMSRGSDVSCPERKIHQSFSFRGVTHFRRRSENRCFRFRPTNIAVVRAHQSTTPRIS